MQVKLLLALFGALQAQAQQGTTTDTTPDTSTDTTADTSTDTTPTDTSTESTAAPTTAAPSRKPWPSEIQFNNPVQLIAVCLNYCSMIICESSSSDIVFVPLHHTKEARAHGGKSMRRRNIEKKRRHHQEKTRPSSNTKTFPSKEGEDHKHGRQRSKIRRSKLRSAEKSRARSSEMRKSADHSNEHAGRDRQCDNMKISLQPKIQKATLKEKQIAAGAKRKSTDYPTMDEILSDWDDNDEAGNQQGKKNSAEPGGTPAKNAALNSAEGRVPTAKTAVKGCANYPDEPVENNPLYDLVN
ncbi:hypothetical protein Aduo_010817 [Ancylostoma duodenale]